MGSKGQYVNLLIDTLANGTAVKYDYEISESAVSSNESERVMSKRDGLEFTGNSSVDLACFP